MKALICCRVATVDRPVVLPNKKAPQVWIPAGPVFAGSSRISQLQAQERRRAPPYQA